jgi:cell division protein FtsX
MSFKDVVFCLICAATWFILLPLFVVGGMIALLGYAIASELTEIFLGRTAKALDKTAAREIARRMCLGH